MESQNNPISKVVICSDKFKGGLSSLQVAEAVKAGLLRYGEFRKGEPSFLSYAPEFKLVEMADGGDGSADLFARLTGADRIDVQVCGPLGNTISSYYMKKEDVAFVECAKACGLAMVPLKERNPLKTTTYGVGQLIRHAIENGACTIYIGVGGSSSNDCGIGMLQGLGFSVGLPPGMNGCGGNLHLAGKVTEPADMALVEKIASSKFIIINDVDNPLCGPEGAAIVFSPQKGADKRMAQRLDEEARGFLLRCGETSFSKTDAQKASMFPGAGTAGGMGFALLHFLGAESISGFEFFGNYLQNLGKKIEEAEFIITGEGRVDNQSLMGKVVGGVTQALSKIKEHKRLWVVCGKSSIAEEEIAKNCGKAEVKIYQLADIEPNIAARMKREAPLLSQLAYFAAMETDALL